MNLRIQYNSFYGATMRLKDELSDFIYRSVLTVILAVLLFLESYNLSDPELITKKHIIYLLVMGLSFNVLLVLYHRIHFYLFPAVFIVIAVFSVFLESSDIEIFLNSTIFKLLIISFSAFVVFLISDSSVPVGLILSVGLACYMLIFVFRDMEPHPYSPALAFFYICFTFTKISRNKLKNRNTARTRKYLTFLLPFLLAIPLLLIVVPKPENPISWQWFIRLCDYTSERIEALMHELSLKLFSTENDRVMVNFGYNEDMTYNNESGNDNRVLSVKSEDGIYGSLYLKGEVFNTFKNGGWSNTIVTDKDYSTIDAYETYYGLLNFDKNSLNSFVKKTTVRMNYLDFTSDIMFAPAKILPPTRHELQEETHPVNEHLLFDHTQSYGTQYSLSFLQLNYGSPALTDFLNNEISEDPEVFDTVKKNYLSSYNDLTLEYLQEYRQYIYKNYTSVPVIRDSVKLWLEDATEGYTSDYEKLLNLEYALSSMVYDLNPGNLPDYVKDEGDFINYFIIEQQKGYCVHYATAFCLLARYLGYPARVVQGYKAYLTDGSAEIMNSNGHTWPEVYFPQKGWIAFEPTPGMAIERYKGWPLYFGKYSEYEGFDFDFTREEKEEATPVTDLEYKTAHEERRISGMLILIIISIVIVSVVFLLTTGILINIHKRKKMSDEELYLYEFKLNILILKEFNIERSGDETLEEFGQRAITELKAVISSSETESKRKIKDPDMLNAAINEDGIIRDYEAFIYGGKNVNKEKVSVIVIHNKALTKLMKLFYKHTYLLHRLHIYIRS